MCATSTKIRSDDGPVIAHDLAVKIFSKLDRHIADPRIELHYYSDFTLMVAVVLSAQSTDKGVNKVTPALFAIANTPEKMLLLGEAELSKMIRSLGLYLSKAKNIIAASRMLVEQFQSKIPSSLDDLLTLPGIGRKSANVLLHCLFDIPTIAVDTHVFRVSHRIGLARSKSLLGTEQDLMRTVPDQFLLKAHHLLVLHGRYTCKARKPDCGNCPITEHCSYYLQHHSSATRTNTDVIPSKSPIVP